MADSPEELGSGVAFATLIKGLREQAAAGYRAQLEPLTKRAKGKGQLATKDLDLMLAGFEDGMSAMLGQLRRARVLAVIDDPPAPEKAPDKAAKP